MKFEADFDDGLAPKGQRRRPSVRSIGQLLMMVAVCGAVVSLISVYAETGKQKRNTRLFAIRAPRSVQIPQAQAPAPRPPDPFVVTATAEIDAKIVVPAPAIIDEAMVFNPYTRDRHSALGASASGSALLPFPATSPGQLPEWYLPQRPAPAQPR
jgi:hypothetical protein